MDGFPVGAVLSIQEAGASGAAAGVRVRVDGFPVGAVLSREAPCAPGAAADETRSAYSVTLDGVALLARRIGRTSSHGHWQDAPVCMHAGDQRTDPDRPAFQIFGTFDVALHSARPENTYEPKKRGCHK